MVSVNNNILVQ